MDVLTRIYPCGECASHFSQIVRCGKGGLGPSGQRKTLFFMCGFRLAPPPLIVVLDLAWGRSKRISGTFGHDSWIGSPPDCFPPHCPFRRYPPEVQSGALFRRWLCHVHNEVNLSIGKPTFNCDLVESR